MPSKSVKTAKLYLASVMLCIPFIFNKMVKIPTLKLNSGNSIRNSKKFLWKLLFRIVCQVSL